MKSKNISLYDLFFDQGIKFFAGVPDSLLSEFSKELENNKPARKNLFILRSLIR